MNEAYKSSGYSITQSNCENTKYDQGSLKEETEFLPCTWTYTCIHMVSGTQGVLTELMD